MSISRRVLLLVGLAVLCAIPVAVFAQDHEPISFDSEEAYSFTQKQLEDAEAVVRVFNNTTMTRTLTLAIQETEGSETPLTNVAQLPASPVALNPSSFVDIVLAKKEPAPTLDGGTYSGTLFVTEAPINDPDVSSVQYREINIVIPEEDADGTLSPLTGENPVPLVKSWSVNHVRGPFGFGTSPFSDEIIVPLDVETCCDLKLDGREPVGYLTNDADANILGQALDTSGVVPVDPDKLENGKVGLRLDLTDIDSVGAYSGDIDLMPENEDEGTVTLTVNTSHGILGVIVVVALGVAAAFLINFAKNVKQPTLELYQKLVSALKPDAYKQGYGNYTIFDGDQKALGKDNQDYVEFVKGKVEKLGSARLRLNEWSNWKVKVLDETDKAYKDASSEVDALSAQVEAWNGLDEALVGLNASIDKFLPDDEPKYLVVAGSELPDYAKGETLIEPEYLEDAKNLLNGETLCLYAREIELPDKRKIVYKKGNSVQEKTAEVSAAAKLLNDWCGWYKRLLQAQHSLSEVNDPGTIASLPDLIKQARFELARIKTYLEDLKRPEEFVAAQIDALLTNAEGLVAGIKRYHEFDKPPLQSPSSARAQELHKNLLDLKAPQQLQSFLLDLGGFLDEQSKDGASSDSKFSPFSWMPFSIPGQPTASNVKRALIVGSYLLIALSLGAALYGALNTLYFGKSFGSWIDYIGAFAWGFGAQASIDLLYGALGKLVSSR